MAGRRRTAAATRRSAAADNPRRRARRGALALGRLVAATRAVAYSLAQAPVIDGIEIAQARWLAAIATDLSAAASLAQHTAEHGDGADGADH